MALAPRHDHKTSLTPDPTDVIARRHGHEAILDLPGIEGPEVPTLIEARTADRTLGLLGGLLGGLLASAKPAISAAPEGNAPRGPRMRVTLAGGRRFDADGRPVRDVDGPRPGFDVNGQRIRRPRPALLRRPARTRALVTVLKTGAAGLAFMPVKSAWDASAKRSNGAPMVVAWRRPDTQTCRVAVVPSNTARALRDDFRRCDSLSAHGEGAVAMSYEDGRLGPSDGPAIRMFDSDGQPSAPPVFCLDGGRVSPEAHAAGRQQALDGAGLGAAVLAGAMGGTARAPMPGGLTNCNVAAAEEEMQRACKVLDNWLTSNEPKLRGQDRDRTLARAEAIIKEARNQFGSAANAFGDLKASGVEAVAIDFSRMGGGPAALANGLAADAKALAPAPALVQQVEYGEAMKMRA